MVGTRSSKKGREVVQSEAGASQEYTIDELSASTGVPSRTIRFYQAKGALQAPEKRGRIAYYNDDHVERLQIVSTLQERGLNLNAICDLARQLKDDTLSVRRWLGLEEKLHASWIEDEPVFMTNEELRQLAGPRNRPGLILELQRLEYIREEGTKWPPNYLVPSRKRLMIALQLESRGIDLVTTKLASDLMKKYLSRMADGLISLFIERFFHDGDVSEINVDQLSNSIEALRETWLDSTQLLLAEEIERAIRESIERGDFIKRRRRRRK